MMPDDEVLKALEAHYSAAVGHTEDEIANAQDDALSRYLGHPYGDEVAGRSQVVSRDCAQAVDWALPDLLEPFISGDNIVEFEPSVTDLPASMPEEQRMAVIERATAEAKQATELCGHVFWNDNDGFLLLHDSVKGGLIQKVGFAKVWFEETTEVKRRRMTGISPITLQELQADANAQVEIIGEEAVDLNDVQDDDLAALYPEGASYSVEVTKTTKKRRVRVAYVPADEIKVALRAVRLPEVPYIVHEPPMTVSSLIAMGFDREIVENLPKGTTATNQDRQDIRFHGEDSKSAKDVPTGDDATRPVDYKEEYVLLDRDEDGIAERLKVCRVGNVILSEPEPCDDHPFVGWSPMPLMGRLWGESMIDKSRQLQRINTSLSRQMLDNLYLANTPQREVPERAVVEDGSTYADLLNPKVGSLVRTKEAGLIREIVTPDRSDAAMRGLSWFAEQKEMDTGITRNAVGLSTEAIDPKSAQESKRIDRGSQGRKRLMARVYAEMFLKSLFSKMLKLLVEHQDGVRVVKIRGNYVPIDPAKFSPDMAPTIKVGLGFQNRDEQLAAAMSIMEVQAQGFEIGLVRPEHLYATAEKLIEAVGWRFADQYFAKPDPNAPPAQEKPDPAMAEVQAKMQLKQAEMQADMQVAQAKAQMEAQIQLAKMQAAREIEAGKAQMSFQTDMAKIDADYSARMQQIGAEMQLKREQMAEETKLKRQQIAVGAITKVQSAKANGSGQQPVRFGGQVG